MEKFQTAMLRASLLLILACLFHCEGIIIPTKLGKIRGLEETSLTKGTKYYAFKGVPFAKPPIGDLRFKEPIPVDGWKSVLDATADGPVCPQLNIGTNKVIGNEDCLSINVYTPDLDKLNHVIVWIHGGGFTSGSSHSLMFGPDYLIESGVVLVTLNYRLHVLGFLSTGTDEATGNYGLHDQIMALKWIQTNIASFGGDASKVTLMGEGAGAASATLLTLTPQSKGLFNNVIALGGSPLNSQYFQPNPSEAARELVSRFECSHEDFGKLVECLRKQDVEKLVKEVNNMFSFFTFPRWFGPSVDNTLFTKSPLELITEGRIVNKVPVLMGIARHEGAFYYPLTLNSFNDGKYDGNFIDQRFPRLLPVISEFESKLLPTTKLIKRRYFQNVDLENEDEFRPRYVEFLTDMLYTRFSSKYASLLSNQSIPVYYYLLDYYGSHSIMDVIGDTTVKMVAHGDILTYIFTQVLGENVHLPDDDKQFSTKTLTPLLVNFAKGSNPTPSGSSFGLTWPTFDEQKQTVCQVGRTLSLVPNFRSNILRFWENDMKNIGKSKDEL